jgi:dTMP kinase
MFVVFEGVDGTGKSTQLQRCQKWLADLGRPVMVCRDPGSTELGDRLRDVLLDRIELRIDEIPEMFLFMAARAQLVCEVIRPALADGQIVLCDRFLLSNVVYQGRAGSLDPSEIWRIGATATGGLLPDATLIFDVPLEIALTRMGDRMDRMESRGEEYLAAVQRGFLAESAVLKGACVIDATGDPVDIHKQVRSALEPLL